MKEYNTSENTWELIENLNSCARTLQHFERGGDKIKLSKVVWHVIKSWNKVSGWGVSSSSSLLLLIFFNRQRVFCLAQSWVWHNILCNQESFAKRQLVLLSLKNLWLQLIVNTVQWFSCHTHTWMTLMSTLSTFEMWLHHHTENRVIETVNTDNVQRTVRYSDLFCSAKAIVVLMSERRFWDMADVERFHLYPHLNRILRTGIMRREIVLQPYSVKN
jgi:hypothetical protein